MTGSDGSAWITVNAGTGHRMLSGYMDRISALDACVQVSVIFLSIEASWLGVEPQHDPQDRIHPIGGFGNIGVPGTQLAVHVPENLLGGPGSFTVHINLC